MRKITLFGTIIYCLLLLVGCGNQTQRSENLEMARLSYDEVATEDMPVSKDMMAGNEIPLTNITSAENRTSGTHMLIYRATMNIQVDNVAQASHDVEGLAQSSKGYIASSDFRFYVTDRRETRISDDSIRVFSKYLFESTVTVRVPTDSLGAYLAQVAKLAKNVTSRNINTEDIQFSLLASNLQAKSTVDIERIMKNAPTSQIDYSVLYKAHQDKNNKLVEQQRNLYDMNYAYVTIQLSQNDVPHDVVECSKLEAKDTYRSNLFLRMWDGLKRGLVWGSDLLVGLVYIWPLYIIIGIVWYLVRLYRRKRAAKKNTKI